jgi:diguanylate cyclase (GGDEF)-like protein
MSPKSPTPKRHVVTELAALRAAPQLQNVAALERGEKLLQDYVQYLMIDETLFVLRLCASGCQAAGRWLDGLQFARRGIEMATLRQRVPEHIAFLAISGNIHSFLRNQHLAVRAMREAIVLAEQHQLLEDHIKLLQGLAPMYSKMEMHDSALALYARAFELLGRNAQAPQRAVALNNIARTYCAMGQFDKATEHIEAAFKAADTQINADWLPHLMHTQAEILAARGAHPDAIKRASVAAASLRERKNVPLLLRVLIDSASWMQFSGQLDGARVCLQEAAALPKDASLHELHEALALAQMSLERACQRPDSALAAFDDYLQARANGDKVHLASQRVATQFVEDVDRTEARSRREGAAVNELTLRLIETQAEAKRMARANARDPLTGALNRAAFDEAVARLATGESEPTSLLMLDIDNFRDVNSQYGHLGGDAVLQAVVSRIRLALRTHDLVGRFGGDEFLLMCHGVGPRIGSAIANRVLQSIAAQPIMHGNLAIAITVSVGVACAHTAELNDLAYLIKRADAALSRAKRGGKNCAITVRVGGA